MTSAKAAGSQHTVGGLYSKCPVCQTHIPAKWLSSSEETKMDTSADFSGIYGDELGGTMEMLLLSPLYGVLLAVLLICVVFAAAVLFF